MSRFYDLLAESIIVQSIITLLLVATICIMYLRNLPIPHDLQILTFTVVGFWFGQKVQFKSLKVLKE